MDSHSSTIEATDIGQIVDSLELPALPNMLGRIVAGLPSSNGITPLDRGNFDGAYLAGFFVIVSYNIMENRTTYGKHRTALRISRIVMPDRTPDSAAGIALEPEEIPYFMGGCADARRFLQEKKTEHTKREYRFTPSLINKALTDIDNLILHDKYREAFQMAQGVRLLVKCKEEIESVHAEQDYRRHVHAFLKPRLNKLRVAERESNTALELKEYVAVQQHKYELAAMYRDMRHHP